MVGDIVVLWGINCGFRFKLWEYCRFGDYIGK